MEAVGFVDDDPAKNAIRIRGLPVLGKRHDIPAWCVNITSTRWLLPCPPLRARSSARSKRFAKQLKVKTRIIPGIYELLDGKVSVNQIRDVEIEDLLRRDPVQTDMQAVRTLLNGKRVLITGGGGSIGSELCRQVLRCEPAQLVVLGHGENSVFAIHHELLAFVRREKLNTRIESVIADVRFARRMERNYALFSTRDGFPRGRAQTCPSHGAKPG